MGKCANELIPFRATHPGEILREELAARGIRQKDFAAVIGMSLRHFHDLIKGKRDITKEIAMKLEDALGISHEFWIEFQDMYYYNVARIRERDKKASSTREN